jgi:hypothetical protein
LNEAAIYAARKGNTIIDETNIMNALDKLIIWNLLNFNETRWFYGKMKISGNFSKNGVLLTW